MQAYHRGYPPPSVAQNRRGGPGPAVPHPGPNPQAAHQMSAQYHQENAKQREAVELAKRRNLRPVDKNIPPGVEEIVSDISGEDAVDRYKKLREVERRLDAVMMRKRLDMQDNVARNSKAYGTMRIWISNTVENQPWQDGGMDPHAFDFSSNVEATFRVKIEGRLLDDASESEIEGKSGNTDVASKGEEDVRAEDGEPAAKRPRLTQTTKSRKKFSHFFKSISIEFDRSRSLQPDGYTQIEWKKPEFPAGAQMDPPREADFDCLEFERKSDENINVTIKLVRDEQPERYKLSKPLAELLDVEEADRKTVMMGLWEYIKMGGLQQEDESRRVICDDRLKKIFEVDSFVFPHLPDMLRRYMFELPPISLPYTIRVDKNFHSSESSQPTVYDIPVPLEDPLRMQMLSVTQSPSHTPTLRQIAGIDENLALLVQKMNESKAKHGFFTSMSKDPANFVKRWMSSQKRDLDVIMGSGPWFEADWQNAEWRKGGVEGPWGSNEAFEGVGTFLSRQK